MADVGLGFRRVYANPEAKSRFIVRNGKPVAAPTSPGAFLRTPLFSLGAKFRLVAEPFISRGGEQDERLADFVRRRLGKEFLDYAINPFVGGIYAGDPELLSVQQAFPKLRAVEERYGSLILGQFLGARERRQRGEVSKQSAPMFSFDEGLETLPRTIAHKLAGAVRLNSAVSGLRKNESGWEISIGDERRQHSSVLLAIGAHPLSRLQIDAEGLPDLKPLGEVVYGDPASGGLIGLRVPRGG